MKRICSLLLALVLVIGMIPVQANAAVLDNGLEYEIYEDHVTITGYAGNPTELVIPAEYEGLPVTGIGDYAFRDCNSMTSISIPDSVTYIGDVAFRGCTGLTGISFPDSVTYIGYQAFSECTGLTSFSFPAGISSVSTFIFSDCTNLTSVTIPEGVTSIDYYAFVNCTSLVNVSLPEGLTFLDKSIFEGCTSLTSIDLPKSVTHIGDRAFYGCTGLTSIDIPDSVTEISPATFYNCENLTSVALPDSLTHIGEEAFRSCTSLTSIVIPDGVTEIGLAAFISCENLTSVALPDSLTHIDDLAFSYCHKLVDVSIPKNVTHIDSAAFQECESIKEITLPAGLVAIEPWAFYRCSDLDIIRFEGNSPQIGTSAFHSVTATAYYPANNPTWTADVKQNYGGNITWVPHDPNHTHEYTPVVTAPTCIAQGYTTYSCSCGYSYTTDYVDALGHDYADGICTRCGEADPDYVKPVENPFTDVPAGCWYEAPVLWALENGVTSGTSETTFSPGNQCLRAHVVTFLWNAEETPAPAATSSSFTDVPAGAWYEKPVLWAVENGITSGVSTTKFGAGDVCSRYQVVYFLWKAAGAPEPETTVNPFTDVNPGHFFYKAVLWAVENGITSGTSETTFSPAQPCNRAQVVTFLYAAYN